MNYRKIRNKFGRENTNWWLFRGSFGIVMSIILLPVTLIKIIITVINSAGLSYEAYERIIDKETADVKQHAYDSFALNQNDTDLIGISIVSPCFEAAKGEDIMIRSDGNRTQSTLIEATEIIFDGAAVRVFSRKFSTIASLLRESAETVFVSDIISIKMTEELKKLKGGVIFYDSRLVIATAGKERAFSVNGGRQNKQEVFLQTDKYFSSFKRVLLSK